MHFKEMTVVQSMFLKAHYILQRTFGDNRYFYSIKQFLE